MTRKRSMLRKLAPEGRRILDAVVRYRANPLDVARTYWQLYRHRQFSPDEIHFFRLLDPRADLDCVVSKEELLAVQRRLNPPELRPLTEDKLRFHAHCVDCGLPTPRIHAVWSVAASRAQGLRRLDGIAELAAFLDTVADDSLVLKPVDGVHGEGVARLERCADGWKDHRGEAMSVERIRAWTGRSGYDGWMFQERIHGHPQLNELSDTQSLQTLRAVTWVDGSGNVELLAVRLRLVGGDHAHDNFDYGRAGNLIAILDPATGTVRSVVGGSGDPLALCHVTTHHRTRRELIGYRVPQWSSARELAIAAAEAFRPLRTVGWDIALTATDPCLIEGNVTWDTLSGDPRMGAIHRRLREAAEDPRSGPATS